MPRSLATLTDTEKIARFEKVRNQRNNNMKKYRESHLEVWQDYARKKAKEFYWRKKGFTINENGEKIPIEPTLVISQ